MPTGCWTRIYAPDRCIQSIVWIGSLFWYVNAYRMLGMNICTRSMYSMVSLWYHAKAYRMLGMNICTINPPTLLIYRDLVVEILFLFLKILLPTLFLK